MVHQFRGCRVVFRVEERFAVSIDSRDDHSVDLPQPLERVASTQPLAKALDVWVLGNDPIDTGYCNALLLDASRVISLHHGRIARSSNLSWISDRQIVAKRVGYRLHDSHCCHKSSSESCGSINHQILGSTSLSNRELAIGR